MTGSPALTVPDEPQDAVVVDLFGPRRVDAALGGDAVRAPWAVVIDEALHVEAQLAKGRGATGAGSPAPTSITVNLRRFRGETSRYDASRRSQAVAGSPSGTPRSTREPILRRSSNQIVGHETTPVRTAIGSEMLPTTTASTTTPAATRATWRARRPVVPRSLTAVHNPCERCSASTNIAKT